MTDIEFLVRPCIRALCPYSTARDEYSGSLGVFLDANESPYETGFNRYPDPHQKALKARLSVIKGLPVENIFVGNGSDEAIDLMFRVFCDPGKSNAVAIAPSYGMYTVAAQTNDVKLRTVLLREDFSLDSDAILAACDSDTRIVFLCSPNNPSGNAFSHAQLLDLADRLNCILVVDEAYADFSTLGSIRSQVLNRPNLVVLQTLSKAYGLAGLRLGLAYASRRIIQLMSMVKYPYNISKLTQETVLEALKTPIDAQVAEILEQRARLYAVLQQVPFIQKVYPSDANFLLVRVADAKALYNHLLSDGIITRNRDSQPLCKGCLRITVGTPAENDKLLESLKTYNA